MFLRELFESSPTKSRKLGRTFNHLEDLVFFHGHKGALEALQHLKEFATDSGAQSIRMKWDGSPTIYWGREKKNGPLLFATHNAWSREFRLTSSEDVYNFIVHESGAANTPAEKQSRIDFATKLSKLYPVFEAATPKDFVGFVYGDSLFLERQSLDESGVYAFSPNPHTNTTYYVKPNSELGKRVSQAQVMVVGHAYFPKFGIVDEAQEPMNDFSMFNNTADLLMQNPIYNAKPLNVNTKQILETESYATNNASNIDKFLESTAGLSDLKDIIYRFVNQTAKAKQLEHVNTQKFFEWLKTSKVSENKQQKILNLDDQYDALGPIFALVKRIQATKDQIIEQVEQHHSADIWDTNGEGRVRYADENKQFGHIKLVPRKRWTPK